MGDSVVVKWANKKKGETVLNRPYREINIYTKMGKIP